MLIYSKNSLSYHLSHILKVQEPQEAITQYESVIQQLENVHIAESIFAGNTQCQWHKLSFDVDRPKAKNDLIDALEECKSKNDYASFQEIKKIKINYKKKKRKKEHYQMRLWKELVATKKNDSNLCF